MKKGSGSHNWGSETNENELTAEAAETGKGQSDEDGTDGQTEEEEEEENQMTYEEYMLKLKSERSGDLFAQTDVRTVENDFDTKSMITKDGKTPDFIEANYEKVHRERSSGRKKNVISDVRFRSAPTYERRSYNNEGGRGGRGRGRGRGRGGRGRSHRAPNVSDMKSFPALA